MVEDLSRCRKLVDGYWRSVAIQIVSKPENYHGAEFRLRVVRVYRCNGHYEFVLIVGAKAKTVTNNLPLLSVLGVRGFVYLQHRFVQFF